MLTRARQQTVADGGSAVLALGIVPLKAAPMEALEV
jgi:hypothetical protein